MHHEVMRVMLQMTVLDVAEVILTVLVMGITMVTRLEAVMMAASL